MGMGPDCFPSQRQTGKEYTIGDCICSICKQSVYVSDEYIRLLDCSHIYHRICMIHNVASLTNKRFFLTRMEQKEFPDQPLSLCPNCKDEDKEFGYLKKCKGYRKHIIFDLLKDKANVFYSKMQERRVMELTNSSPPGSHLQDEIS